MNLISEIVKLVKHDYFHIPRVYQTVGGMWTVDTWIRDGVRVQVMDEGYTTVITTVDPRLPVIRVSQTLDNILFDIGSEQDLSKLFIMLYQNSRSIYEPSHCPTCKNVLRKALGSSNASCDTCEKIVTVVLKKK